MKKLLIQWFLLGLSLTAMSQVKQAVIDVNSVPKPLWHYQEEYTFDKPSDPSVWRAVEPGLHVAFGSTNKKYMRCEVPDILSHDRLWQETAWKGERLNAQILVWSTDTVDQVRLRISDLKDEKGNRISSDNMKLNLVRYVLSNYPYKGSARDCRAGSTDSVWLMPDRFESFDRFQLPGNTVRPVWLTIDVPPATVAGTYKGRIEILSTSQPVNLNVSVTVQNLVLPDPHDWKFRLDLWQNPWVISSYYQVEPWSEEFIMLLKKHMKLYAQAGGTYITTYAVYSPWSDNSYRLEGSMIEWTKTSQNGWKFDYSIFDKYVQLCLDEGIDRAITVYTPLPWGNRFRYMDEKSGNYMYETWDPKSKVYRDNWFTFLTDLKAHLQKKGWFEKTYLGINENELEYTLAAIKVIKEHSADWKITYAGNWHDELSPLLDDYSPVIESEGSPEGMKQRTDKGFTTTYYVCCTPARPNNFVFSPPSESRYIGWYSAAYGYNGFLRWAYDAWPADPMRDARHTLWPAGDCYLVYPGANSSIRFEMLKEGISDYEKIRILKELAMKSNDRKVKDLLDSLNGLFHKMTAERDYSKRDYSEEFINETLSTGNSIIDNLTESLEKTL